jgi:hypothetical protein
MDYISENIWIDVFKRDEKELYFAVTFEHNKKAERNVLTYWNIPESELQVRLLKSAIAKFHRLESKPFKKEYEEYEIRDKQTNKFCVLAVSKDGNHLASVVDVNVGSNVSIAVTDFDGDKIIEERTNVIKLAKIDHIDEHEIISFTGLLDPIRTEMLLTLTDVERVIKVIDKTLESRLVEDTVFSEKGWNINYRSPSFILGKETDSIEVSYTKEEINELSWAFKRLVVKHKDDIATLDRSEED